MEDQNKNFRYIFRYKNQKVIQRPCIITNPTIKFSLTRYFLKLASIILHITLNIIPWIFIFFVMQ